MDDLSYLAARLKLTWTHRLCLVEEIVR